MDEYRAELANQLAQARELAAAGDHAGVAAVLPLATAKHTPSQLCDCPNPRPGRPYHCAVNSLPAPIITGA